MYLLVAKTLEDGDGIVVEDRRLVLVAEAVAVLGLPLVLNELQQVLLAVSTVADPDSLDVDGLVGEEQEVLLDISFLNAGPFHPLGQFVMYALGLDAHAQDFGHFGLALLFLTLDLVHLDELVQGRLHVPNHSWLLAI